MVRKKLFKWLVKTAACASLCLMFVSVYAQEGKPNILIFFGDDMNWMDSRPYGNPQVATPNISHLAKEGISLDNMFTSTAMCSPSRQQFLTGLYPVKSGAYPNHSVVYDSVQSMAHYFQQLGYKVGLIGKKHFGPDSSFPFQYFGGRHHDNGKGQDIDLSKIESFVKEGDQPFVLIIAQNQPHTPWNRGDNYNYPTGELLVPEYMVDTEMTRTLLSRYYREITYADSLLGLCLDYLDESGKEENTLTIFTSEQGSEFPFGKWTCYDLGLKTQFIARWPGKIKPSTRNDALINYVDVLPTLIEAAGGTLESLTKYKLDGESFLQVLLGSSSYHRDYVYGIQTTRGIGRGSACYPIRSVRSKRYKYIFNLHHEDPFYNVVTANPNSIFYNWLEATKDDPDKHNWIERYKFRPEEELYDLENDPYEKNNLAQNADFAEVKQKLKEELLLWMKSQGDQGLEIEMMALERQPEVKNWKPFNGIDCN